MIRHTATAAQFCVRRIRATELDTLLESWNELSGGNPFLRWEWLVNWWRHYSDDGQFFTLGVFDHCGTLIGLAPWYLQNDPWKGRVIRFLGSGEVCTDYLSLLARHGAENEVITAIANWLTQPGTRPDGQSLDLCSSGWDLLELTGVDSEDRLICRLIEQLESLGHAVHRRRGLDCWRLELPPTWDQMLARLSKSHRKQLRRLQRRAFDTGRAVLHTVCNESDLPRGRQILIDLHQQRRQTLGEPGCFASARFASFHEEVMRDMLTAGLLRLHWIECDGEPIAAEYHLAGSDTVYAYQAGMNPEALQTEPGRLAAMATLRLAQENGFRAFDLLRGDEPYKAHWRAVARPSLEFRVAARHRSARWRHRLWTTASNAKHWLQSGGRCGNPAHQTQSI